MTMKSEYEVSGKDWTSSMEAATVLDNLLQIWLYWGCGSELEFRTTFIEEMRKVANECPAITDFHPGAVYMYGGCEIIEEEGDLNSFILAKLQGLEQVCIFAIKALDAKCDSSVAWMNACQANNSLGVLVGLISGGRAESDVLKISNRKKLSRDAKIRAVTRWASDPTKKAKEIAKGCWDEWQKNPSRYKNQPDFVNDVLEKVETKPDGSPVIAFNTVLKKYIPEWKRIKKQQCSA